MSALMDVITDPVSVLDAELDAARSQLERAEARLFSVVGSDRLGNWMLTAVQIKQADRLRRECRKARERLDAALAASASSAQVDLSTLSVVGPTNAAVTTTRAAGLAISLFSH